MVCRPLKGHPYISKTESPDFSLSGLGSVSEWNIRHLLPHFPLLSSSLKIMFVRHICEHVPMSVCVKECMLGGAGIYFSNYIWEGVEKARLVSKIGKNHTPGNLSHCMYRRPEVDPEAKSKIVQKPWWAAPVLQLWSHNSSLKEREETLEIKGTVWQETSMAHNLK